MLYPKDLIIGAVTVVCTFVTFGIAQSREPRIAKLKGQYPSLVPFAVVALAVLIIYVLGSLLVFIWGVTVPIAGICQHQYNGIFYFITHRWISMCTDWTKHIMNQTNKTWIGYRQCFIADHDMSCLIMCWKLSCITFFFHHHFHLSQLMTTSTSLILAVCRTHVT